MKKPFDLSLYLVLDPDLCQKHSMVETARMAVAGGATVVQVRHKHASTAERIELARAVCDALKNTQALIVMNDDIEAAIAAGVDGVHIGQQDVAPVTARQRIGPDKVLGLSVHSLDQIRAVQPDIVDYAGIGPVFATPTKPNHETPLGLPGLADMVAHSPVPTVAIGGLKQQHVADVFATGAHGMAVVSAICGMPDPQQASQALWERVLQARSGI